MEVERKRAGDQRHGLRDPRKTSSATVTCSTLIISLLLRQVPAMVTWNSELQIEGRSAIRTPSRARTAASSSTSVSAEPHASQPQKGSAMRAALSANATKDTAQLHPAPKSFSVAPAKKETKTQERVGVAQGQQGLSGIYGLVLLAFFFYTWALPNCSTCTTLHCARWRYATRQRCIIFSFSKDVQYSYRRKLQDSYVRPGEQTKRQVSQTHRIQSVCSPTQQVGALSAPRLQAMNKEGKTLREKDGVC